ncbi:LysR family transcriptional regulator [Siccirubricoccus phaeus]|uniref:LysR family transcriptional regulator n=1 Tax=Siccirubricoccus phaeus TaxID=2595053 RepID=UPI0011F2032E|nr:LysR family transcriptional regulator [Siccirubricoccus phaeus]
MDRLDELRLLVAILETGSLAAAGRRLGHSPPAVTRGLAGLEERLGVRLLDRTTRQSRPTEAGRRLGEQARRLLAEYEDAMAEAAGAAAVPRGRLRIAAPLVFGRLHVAPLVTAFLDAQPLVSAELILSDRNADLLEEEIDVAIRIGALTEAGLVARKVGSVRRVLAASPDYLARHGRPTAPADLAMHQVIQFAAPGTPTPEWRFQGPGGQVAAVRVAPRFSVNQAEAALEAAVAGRGILRLLSYQAAEAFAAGRLERLLREWEPAAHPVSLVLPSARLLPPRVRAFLDFAAPRLSALAVLREG